MRVGEKFCPGIVHAVPAKDGLLLRIRVPGGLIETSQLRAVADLSRDFADGFVEITSRANLQIRAVRAEDLSHIVEAISLAGLLPSPEHDRVRNIISSPVAGVDEEELIDPRPLVYELDRRLRSDAAFVGLHPKFSFAIYGGSRRFNRDRDDIGLSAVRVGEVTLLQLSLSGSCLGFAVPVEHAVDVALTVAKTCIALASEYRVPVRAKQILEVSGALDRITDPVVQWLIPCSERPPTRVADARPLGVYPTVHQDRVSIIPSIPLGRLTAEQARSLAELMLDCEADLRLASWRGVVLASVPQNATGDIIGKLRGIGLSCDGEDGFCGIAACAGTEGCDASLADVRRDSASLAQLLVGHAVTRGWAVNFSGCEKQCGRRQGATVDLIGTSSGYNLSVDGQLVAQNCSPAVAIDAVVAFHPNFIAEVASR